MLKTNEFKERYKLVTDDRIRKFLQANPVRKLVDFEDPDNENIQFVSYFHEYVMERKGDCDDELIVEYIECDKRFLNGIDLANASERKYFLFQVQNYFNKIKRKGRPPYGYFFRKLRHVPFSLSQSNLYVTTIINGQF